MEEKEVLLFISISKPKFYIQLNHALQRDILFFQRVHCCIQLAQCIINSLASFEQYKASRVPSEYNLKFEYNKEKIAGTFLPASHTFRNYGVCSTVYSMQSAV